MQVFLFREMRNFAKSLWNFTKFRLKFRPTRKDEDRKLQSYVTSSISWLAPNIILIEKKMIYRFICKWWPPRVYEQVCYEMLVAKEYYAKTFCVTLRNNLFLLILNACKLDCRLILSFTLLCTLHNFRPQRFSVQFTEFQLSEVQGTIRSLRHIVCNLTLNFRIFRHFSSNSKLSSK